MDLFKKAHDYTVVKDAISSGYYPYFTALESKQDTQVTMKGKETIMIGSNNYLGLTSNPEVIEATIEAVNQYGSGCSGSRFLNGTLVSHIELEQELAAFLNKEAVLTMSTGFQTNLGIIAAIAGRNDVILCDKENHASIYDACRLSYARMLRYEHNDMAELEELLKNTDKDKGILIVTDGVFSMGGDICNLPQIVALAKKYGARIMVDDSHSFGVLGKHGRGTAEYFGLENEVDIIMGTFSKSMASLGGFMAASKDVVDFVKHTSRPFIFSASMTPASVASVRKSLEILKREPERCKNLLEIAAYMRKRLTEENIAHGAGVAPIIPIYTGTNERTFVACKMLLERGVYVNPVVSPAVPVGQSLLRTSYTATHTKQQIDKAVEIIKQVLTMLPVETE